MPLFPGKSKKAFSKNVATEMDAGDPKKQALAIAYSVQRKNKKKMASGGSVEDSANSESRPSPDKSYNDKDSTSRNSGRKALKDSDWTDSPTIKQAQKPSPTPLSRPKLIGSDAFASRNKTMRDEEADFMDIDPPQSPANQPRAWRDEVDADGSGDDLSDNELSHSTGKKAYTESREDKVYATDEAEEDMKQKYAKGGPIMQPKDHGDELDEREDEMDMQRNLSSTEHGEQPASWRDEVGADDSGADMRDDDEKSYDRDMLYQKNQPDSYSKTGIINYARGGHVDMSDEEDDEHHSSVAAAIMSKRKMMAEGGEVDLQANSNEDLNYEDQLSYQAARKKTYYDDSQISKQPDNSNLKGDDLSDEDENNRDMISKIRAMMKSKKMI
jgi:hypothetical protein